MATPLHGKGGSITWGGSCMVTRITNWSAVVSGDVSESTGMNETWKTFLAGQKGWTGSCEGVYEDANSAINAVDDEAALKLSMVDGGDNLSGSAIMTSVNVSTSKDDVITVSYEFQGTGALAYAAS